MFGYQNKFSNIWDGLTTQNLKLFNYYIQATETETNIRKIKDIQDYLEDKKTKLVLYIYDAFILGRAAIVAQDYDLRDEQASIIKVNVDKIIAQKAIDYLTSSAGIIASGASREDAFHGLSEGYGFVLSLQFTDLFSNGEFNSMLDQMMEGDGFWTISADDLNSMASTIQTVAGL